MLKFGLYLWDKKNPYIRPCFVNECRLINNREMYGLACIHDALLRIGNKAYGR